MGRSCRYVDALTTLIESRLIQSTYEAPRKGRGPHMSDRITAAEAAARLGVKRETLYAYVSRGLLESRTLDGKTSTFDPAEIDALRRTRNRPRAGRLDTSIVSALTHVDDQHVFVRGHDLVELATKGVGFESVASLLWT